MTDVRSRMRHTFVEVLPNTDVGYWEAWHAEADAGLSQACTQRGKGNGGSRLSPLTGVYASRLLHAQVSL